MKQIRISNKQSKSKQNIQEERREWDHLKRSSKTYEACQQGCLLGLFSLLNISISIEKVYKKSTKTSPLLNIKTLTINNTNYSVDEYITLKSSEIKERCDEDRKWASRLLKRSNDSLSFEYLLSLAEENGIEFQLKKTRKAEFTVVMQKIKSIAFTLNGMKYILEKNEIRDFGLSINAMMIEKMNGSNRQLKQTTKFVELEGNDENVLELFQQFVMKCNKIRLSAFTPVRNECLTMIDNVLCVNAFVVGSQNTSDDFCK